MIINKTQGVVNRLPRVMFYPHSVRPAVGRCPFLLAAFDLRSGRKQADDIFNEASKRRLLLSKGFRRDKYSGGAKGWREQKRLPANDIALHACLVCIVLE